MAQEQKPAEPQQQQQQSAPVAQQGAAADKGKSQQGATFSDWASI